MDEEYLRMRLMGVKRLLVLGVGNEFEGDDGVGIVLARRLKKRWRSSRRFRAIDAGLTPENSIAAIRRFDPSHVLLVDATDMGLPPGSVRIIEREMISGLTISTHSLSLSLIAEYLEKEMGTNVTVVGIQPLNVGSGQRISEPVAQSLNSLENVLSSVSERRA
jgi:hydrogenase 3 maturation protease